MSVSQFCSGGDISTPVYVPLPAQHAPRPADLRKADLQGSNIERAEYSGEWLALPDRMAFCPCEPCNEPQNLSKIKATLIRQQESFIASQPNVASIIVPQNLSQESPGSAARPKNTLLGLPDELLLRICEYVIPREYAEIAAEDFVDPVFFSLSCKRLFGICGRILQTKEGAMNRNAYGSSDKQHLLCKMAECWLPNDKRICWACWRFKAFGGSSKAKWLQMVFTQSDTAEHNERGKVWAQNWEVKNWFGEESEELYNLRSDDERLRCPGCVLKGFRITVSKDFVRSRNMKRQGKEWLTEMDKKDRKEEEQRKKQKKQEDADRKLAEKLTVDDAKIREQPVTGGVKRKAEAVTAGAANVKRRKEEGCTNVSDMKEQRGILQPAWSHHTLCPCGACSEEFFRRMECGDSDYNSDYGSDV